MSMATPIIARAVLRFFIIFLFLLSEDTFMMEARATTNEQKE
jgi:hypothetical protein